MVPVPDDVWGIICDFLGTRRLSHTCLRLWQLLQHRHVKASGSTGDLGVRLQLCQDRVHLPCLPEGGSAPPPIPPPPPTPFFVLTCPHSRFCV